MANLYPTTREGIVTWLQDLERVWHDMPMPELLRMRRSEDEFYSTMAQDELLHRYPGLDSDQVDCMLRMRS